jgi:isoquinoline 1-oxidoreductase alpha subunit
LPGGVGKFKRAKRQPTLFRADACGYGALILSGSSRSSRFQQEKRMAYRVEINGEVRELDVPAEMPLLWALRNELGMVGTKFGCGIGACGACTVHVDGVAARSCSLQVGSIGNRKVTTIEALADSEIGRALQAAWLEEDVMQCGYCQAGQLMSASSLLARNPKPSTAQIDQAMAGNICRCACYTRIRDAIVMAANGETANA